MPCKGFCIFETDRVSFQVVAPAFFVESEKQTLTDDGVGESENELVIGRFSVYLSDTSSFGAISLILRFFSFCAWFFRGHWEHRS